MLEHIRLPGNCFPLLPCFRNGADIDDKRSLFFVTSDLLHKPPPRFIKGVGNPHERWKEHALVDATVTSLVDQNVEVRVSRRAPVELALTAGVAARLTG